MAEQEAQKEEANSGATMTGGSPGAPFNNNNHDTKGPHGDSWAPPGGEPPLAKSSKLYATILTLVICICYYNSLQCGFVFDDASAIKDNKDLRPSSPWKNLFLNDFWGTPMHKEKSHKSYRPLCVLTFRLNYAFSELEPMSYHLVNVLLHATVTVIYMSVCKLFVSELCSFLAALMFAVHPIHTEAVTGVVGRAELLSSIFALAAFLFYVRCSGWRAKTDWRYLLLTLFCVGVAMLCKEQGITVIGICCVYEVFIAQRMTIYHILETLASFARGKPQFPPWLREGALRACFLVFSTVFLLVARIRVMGAQLPVFTKFDNPASVAPFPARHLTFNYLLPVNLWLLLEPNKLCCDWTMGTIPLITSLLDLRNLATVAFYAGLLKLILYSLTTPGARPRVVIMCLSFVVLPFIPASNLFFPVGFVVAERILYIPSMGFSLLVAAGFQALIDDRPRLRKLLWMGMACMVLLHAAKTVTRNYDWESEYTLFRAALRVNQRNAKLWNNVGHALENQEKFNEALEYFEKAASVQPDDIGAHSNVGRTYTTLNDHEAAEAAYRKALALMPPVIPGQSYQARIAPQHLNVFLNLGNLLAKNNSRLLEADHLYRQAISMRADYIQAYINRGDILMKLNRTKEAQQTYQQALRYENDNADLYYNLGVVFLEQKRDLEALRNFEEALTHDPEHKQALFNSAVLMQEMGNPAHRPAAKQRLHQLLEIDPSDEKIYFNLGMLATDDKDLVEAEKWFRKSVELKADFRSALFNLALLLNNDLKRPQDAHPVLVQLLKFFPDHIKGMILMGDININHLKDYKAAEKSFRSILALEPDHVQANHNLCVVYVELGDLYAAEKCLQHVHQLAPTEQYILYHLQVVQERIRKVQAAQKSRPPANQRSPTDSANQRPGSNPSSNQDAPNKNTNSQSANHRQASQKTSQNEGR